MIYSGEIREEALEGVQFSDGFIPRNGGAEYFLRDHLGSVRVVAKDSNTVVRRTDYLPFGVRMSGDGNQSGSGRSKWFGFGGKENAMISAELQNTLNWTPGERYQHFGARTYDPFTCTFLQIDPMAEKYYGMSPYGYCAGDPVNMVDLDGLTDYFNSSGAMVYRDLVNNGEIRVVTSNQAKDILEGYLSKGNIVMVKK